ncbi:MAG: glucokinase [Gammaproteobacteria bacterium]|nr:glucokinase [Gammaproteobacteria bacterium]
MHVNQSRFLLADVGGTQTRIAIDDLRTGPNCIHIFDNAKFADLASLLSTYFSQIDLDHHPRIGAIAVASPIQGDTVQMTNRRWKFSIKTLRKHLGLNLLHVINDFTAVALAVPHIKGKGRVRIGKGGVPLPGFPIGILGPGTGLGVSVLIPDGKEWRPLASEGGHATLATVTEEEARIVKRLRERYGHVSAERVLSGPGLVALYRVITELEGLSFDKVTPEEISQRALRSSDPLALRTLETFFAMLGTVAGNLALIMEARGGVYLAGGILPKMVQSLKNSQFRERFTGKGRFRTYLRAIPTFLICEPCPALRGLHVYLKRVTRT